MLLLMAITLSLAAQNSGCNVKKTYLAAEGTTINLINKYGDINIIEVNRDSLSICAVLTIDQKNRELAQKSIELVTMDIDKIDKIISATTIYDRRFFNAQYRQDRKSFSVDYIVEVPSYIDLNVTNTFGNVTVGEFSGQVTINISHGTLSVKKLTRGNTNPVNSISADHSDINVSDANWLTLRARNCPSVTIDKGQALLIESDFSKIYLGEISSLVSNSKSDSYNIESIKNMVSESLYSSFQIENLSGKFKAMSGFGSININDLKRDFKEVDISSGHTLITIKTEKGISFKSDITANNIMVDFAFEDNPGIVKSKVNNTITYTGVAGDNNQTNSSVRIQSNLGKISIK